MSERYPMTIVLKPDTASLFRALKDMKEETECRKVSADEMMHDVLVEMLIRRSRVSSYTINKKRQRKKLNNMRQPKKKVKE